MYKRQTFLSAATPVTNPQAQPKTTNSSLLNAYLNNIAMINAPVVKVQKPETTTPANYHNNLRSLFRNNAVSYTHLIQAILMGIVQGLSEFLPISSSAHLVFTSNFYKVMKNIPIVQSSNEEVFFDIMVHLGTLIAVLIFFRKDVAKILKAMWHALSLIHILRDIINYTGNKT